MSYSLMFISILFMYCSEPTNGKVEIYRFSKECLKGYLDKAKNDIENDFLIIDSTKQVKYNISDGMLSCKIYTEYDCIDEKSLQGSFVISNDTITLFMTAKSNGISSTCICPSYLTYKLKGINPQKKYIVRYTGIKFSPI